MNKELLLLSYHDMYFIILYSLYEIIEMFLYMILLKILI